MKKAFLLLTAAIVAMVACNKNEVRVAEPAMPGEMSLRAVSSPVTKAGELTGTILPNSYGIYAAATQRTPGGVIENASFFNDPFEQLFGTSDATATAASLWKAGSYSTSFTPSPKYWPLGDVKMDFLAYAIPFDKHQTPNVAANDDWTVKWDNPTVDVASSFTFNAVNTYVHQVDVLYAAANNQSVANNAGLNSSNQQQSVLMNFKHAQALLIFNVKVNSEGNGLVNINDIEFITGKHMQDLRDYQAANAAYAALHAAHEAWSTARGAARTAAEYDDMTAAQKSAWDIDYLAHFPEPANPSEPVAPVRADNDVVLLTWGTFNVDNSRNNIVYKWSAMSSDKDNYRMPFGLHNEWAARKAAHDAWADKKAADGYDAMDTDGKAAWDTANPEPAAAGDEPAADAVSLSNSIVQAQTSKTVQAYGSPIAFVAGGEYAQLGETLLIPEQDKVNFTIKYVMNGNTYYLPYNELRGRWEAGKKYIYNIDMTLHEIIITETVADFTAVSSVVPIQ